MPSRTVLVVEDDPSIRKLLTLTLKRDGYDSREATSVSSALDAVRQQKPDLVLLDVNLPGGTGFDVLRLLRETHSGDELPVIILSALSQENNVVRGLQLGAQDYLTKPFGLNELSQRVKQHLPKA
jgi:two-component system, OmpR family, phosphate regulon response regulator PhoB